MIPLKSSIGRQTVYWGKGYLANVTPKQLHHLTWVMSHGSSATIVPPLVNLLLLQTPVLPKTKCGWETGGPAEDS